MSSNELEQYEVANFVDDALVEGSMSEFMLNEYVYEFPQGGRTIRGLTARAIAHIAQEQNISIKEIIRENQAEGVLYTAVAVKVEPGAPEGEWLRAEGVSYEPLMLNGKMDPFAWQKAMTKASRNARRQLIPAIMQIQAVAALMEFGEKAAGNNQRQQAPPALPAPPPTETDLDRYRKGAFAVFNEKQAALHTLEIDTDTFWLGVREHYGVESRTEMDESNWRNLRASLEAEGFASWIRDLAPAKEDPKADSENIPF